MRPSATVQAISNPTFSTPVKKPVKKRKPLKAAAINGFNDCKVVSQGLEPWTR